MSQEPQDQNVAPARQSQLQSALEAFIRGLPRGTHLTAPEVYRQARAHGLKVSLSTVYRTLNNLSLAGQVQGFVGERGRRYEASEGGHDHDHLICLKCGWTLEFDDKLISGFGKTVAERKGYQYRHSRFDILGVCEPCRQSAPDACLEISALAAENALSACQAASRELKLAVGRIGESNLPEGRKSMKSALLLLQEACDRLLHCLEKTASSSHLQD